LNKRPKQRKLSTIINLTLLAVYLSGSVALVAMVNINAKQQALVNAERYSRLILDRNVVTHAFFNNALKTSLYNLFEEHFFEPDWMSSTFAIKSVSNDYEFFGDQGLYYKEASVNARNPAHEADRFERDFIERLSTDPKLKTYSEIRSYDTLPYFVVLRKGQTIKAQCLLCHGDPADAPEGISSYYGTERGFHRQIGETASAISIRIPLSLAYQNANLFSYKLSGILLLILLVIFAIHYAVSRQFLFKPIAGINSQAQLIANDPEHLGDTLPKPIGRELIEMVESFNLMSSNLRHHQDNLEQTIKERTAQLREANQALHVDIEKRKQVERKLERLRKRNELILNTAREGILGLDKDGRITFLNRAAETLLGMREEDLSTLNLVELLVSDDDEKDLPCPWDLIDQALKNGMTINQQEATLLHRSGRRLPIEFSCAPLVENSIVGAVFSFNDITDRKLSEQEIQKLAFYDQLTGLPNRTLFYDRINQRVSQIARDQQKLALMFLDLDDFKRVNDTHGHDAGDEFLKIIAQRLLDGSRQADSVARLGGDEFVWFGEISDEQNAELIAAKFLENISQPVIIGEHSLSSSVSIGISLYPDSATDVVGLLKCADTAMYGAKQKSKNAYQFYNKRV
jgi:diguanylate cyclase (GGDEF)-like protein/PAS domain S-box-containing protein